MSEIQKYSFQPAKVKRDEIIEKLKMHFAKDNLEIKEFEERLHIATTTTDRQELASVINDLPDISPEEVTESVELDSYYSVNKGKVGKHSAIVCIFGGSSRKGVWNPAEHIHTICIFGGTQIDLRKAKLPPGVTQINLLCVFGGAQIIVPPGVNVEGSGIGLFGGFSNRASEVNYPGAPVVRINGLAVFGGVNVQVKK
jgi:hypothetical protein